MKPTIYYYNDKLNIYDFAYFKNKGYKVIEITNDYSSLTNTIPNDVIFIDFFKYDDIKNILPKSIIFLYLNHEYVHHSIRLKLINDKNPNHTIFFITTHLDDKTNMYDLSFESKCTSFNVHFKETPIVFNKRNKKFNFFNRSANAKRLKIFELIKKENIELKDCYYTFANLIVKGIYPNGRITNTLEEFVEIRNINRLNVDVEYISKFKSEFILIGNRDEYEKGGWEELVPLGEIGKQINNFAWDSYIAFITESENDTVIDLRITEKTIRALLYKNIFLPIKCKGYSDTLRKNGIDTFEDIFGLEEGWDNDSEISSINIFVNSINKINNMSLLEIEEIYNRKDVQQRLENNYKKICHALDIDNMYLQIENKIISLNNKNLL